MPKHYSVFIGRLQPVHIGHLTVIQQALEKTDEIIVVLGSHNDSINTRNPFTSIEREKMLRAALNDFGIDGNRVHTVAVEDHRYNDNAWIKSVTEAVYSVVWKKFNPDAINISFVGPKKENDPDMKDFFPNWGYLQVQNVMNIDATTIRKEIFTCEDSFCPDFKLQNVTETVNNFIMKKWLHTDRGTYLSEEYEIISQYRDSWDPKINKAIPYPVIFQTVDAVVTQAGHVLMVTRGAAPGKGLLALPGGFVNPQETLIDAAIRELREETKINIPDRTLKRCVTWNRTFDDPHRSARGRTITQAYNIKLDASGSLPKVKGSDDAIYAQWIPLARLNRSQVFEDHYDIIRTMTGV